MSGVPALGPTGLPLILPSGLPAICSNNSCCGGDIIDCDSFMSFMDKNKNREVKCDVVVSDDGFGTCYTSSENGDCDLMSQSYVLSHESIGLSSYTWLLDIADPVFCYTSPGLNWPTISILFFCDESLKIVRVTVDLWAYNYGSNDGKSMSWVKTFDLPFPENDILASVLEPLDFTPKVCNSSSPSLYAFI